MARTPLSPAQRLAAVKVAADALPAALLAAIEETDMRGPNDPTTLRAWELVETHGATLHRQSRLLAGKSRGG